MTSNDSKSGPQRPTGAGPMGELAPGAFVTVSENKRICDRSLVDAIWEIVAVNAAHAVLKFRAGVRPLDPALETRIVPMHEYDFYRADDLAAAIEGCRKQPSVTLVRFRDR